MPMPKPKSGEAEDDFIERCMGDDVMNDEFPETKQRSAVCHRQWRDRKKEKKMEKTFARERLSGKEFLEFQNAPETLDAEKRTVDVIWFTGIEVPRWDWLNNEKYILRFDPQGADLSILNSGAPVLDNHSVWDGHSSQKGKVEKAWKVEGVYKATLRFSKRRTVDELWQDIADRIVTKFSMGTDILEEEEFAEKDGAGNKVNIRLAKKWRPFEISVAPLPADFGTDTMSAMSPEAPETATCQLKLDVDIEPAVAALREVETLVDRIASKCEVRASAQGDTNMKEATQTGEEARTEVRPVEAATPVNLDQVKIEAVAADREREREIRAIGSGLRLAAEFVESHATGKTTVEQFRKFAIDESARSSAAEPEVRTQRVEMIRDGADMRRAAMVASLLNRHNPGRYPLTEPARDYVGFKILDYAKDCLEANNLRWRGKNPMEIAQLAFQSSDDFPLILANVTAKTLMDGFALEPSRHREIAARRTAADFKTQTELMLDHKTRLAQVVEGGEIQRGALVESKETWAVKEYGQIVAITRRAIINDDLGAFTRIPQLLGLEVAQLEADTVWGVVTTNATMVDGFALFSTDHSNLTGSGTAISDTSIGVGRKTMRIQTSKGGKVIGVGARFLVAPAGKEQLALQYTKGPNSVFPTTPSGINVYAGMLEPITEPRLDTSSATAWYLFADPAIAPVLIYAYLEGQEGPYTETRMGWNVDGMEIKIRHDFGAGAIDYRGGYKNAGA